MDGIDDRRAAGRLATPTPTTALEHDRQPDPLVIQHYLGTCRRPGHPPGRGRRAGLRLPGGERRHRPGGAGEIEGREAAAVMLHVLPPLHGPGMRRAERPDVLLHHFVHIPWSQP